jgi:hypothetical protein
MALGSGEIRELCGGSDKYQNSHTGRKHKAYNAECNKCTVLNVFRMGNSNSSFTRKYCACGSIAFLVGIIVLAVN